ncbi:MAG: D-alanyl-D-alanine carboxypeptidase [Ruminococcaceae bacterium]|nr:D-alanyl-D-alanine carboxypeptidase [Oscillospiraceae bacterium]
MMRGDVIMLQKIKKVLCICLSVGIVLSTIPYFSANAKNNTMVISENAVAISELDLSCKSAVLMEASTGQILYEQNSSEAMPPASVTKIMTLLLVMEAIEAGKLNMEDMITASAHAASMGGSQIYLKEGEQMTARDMIKSVVISSANDAAVALAEHVAGSEGAFVDTMNRRAAELGMENTHFENTNGLDDTAQNHVTSARDIAIMSRALIEHKEILEYSSIWMDTIRNGAFGLTNTNRLVRFYRGCNGLKTGSTQKAGFCVSVTAEREGMTLICVIMGAESRDIRNAAATKLLDWGFANYGLYTCEGESSQTLGLLKVKGGKLMNVNIRYPSFTCVLSKGDIRLVERKIEIPQSISAPIRQGEAVGEVVFTCQGREIGRVSVSSAETSEKIGFWDVFQRIWTKFLLI